jgi:hypothetical protein
MLAMAMNVTTHSVVPQNFLSDLTLCKTLWNDALAQESYQRTLADWEADTSRGRAKKVPLPNKKPLIDMLTPEREMVTSTRGGRKSSKAMGANYVGFLVNTAINLGDGEAWKLFNSLLLPWFQRNVKGHCFTDEEVRQSHLCT